MLPRVIASPAHRVRRRSIALASTAAAELDAQRRDVARLLGFCAAVSAGLAILARFLAG